MITIVDYGMGNLGSIKNMLARLGSPSVISSNPEDVLSATKLILPGVGHFDLAMRNLCGRGLAPALHQKVLEEKVPILGICLGMQLMTQGSEEGGQEPGLGWIPARTLRFDFANMDTPLKVPHMGWNRVSVHGEHPLFRDMYPDPRFYFVHTYFVRCDSEENVLCTTNYGGDFHSAVQAGNIIGTQFHPEKSHKYGLKLLHNFVEGF